MKFYILLFACSVSLAQYHEEIPSYLSRVKRNAVGALRIVTNHAQPIHADVKPENGDIEKPCPKAYGDTPPSRIEPGVVFQVTPPEGAFYEVKSLRKSLPFSNKLDLIRSISRVVTLTVLVISAVLEFYPLFEHLYYAIYL